MRSQPNAPCKVSIVIKALNEEARIAACIESALQAVDAVGGEVVLADSCSTDQTTVIASRYPIRIVQLKYPHERCCGAGPQLGYLHSRGEFVYILDGDMQMLDGFLPAALTFLEQHTEVGGVGGVVVEQNTHSLEYIARMERASGHMQSGQVDRLDMGGLYRRQAIEQIGFLSNRNLHSYEEFDLAVRLRTLGWRLWRLPISAVNHYGHDAPPYELLRRRWTSGYICGLGEVLRNAWRQPHFGLILSDVRELRLYVLVLLWWLTLLSTPLFLHSLASQLTALSGFICGPLMLMALRKRSLGKGLFSVVSWHFNVLGLLRGLFRRPSHPIPYVAAQVLQEPWH